MCPVDRTGLSASGKRYPFSRFALFLILLSCFSVAFIFRTLVFLIFSELLYLCSSISQCPVTCGGGVRSRTVTCTLAPKKTCDLSTKPRSRSLCALQSCPNSSLRRRPGPPPKHRHIFPPKSHPTKHPVSPTWAPIITTSSAAPTATTGTTTKETTTTSIPNTTPLTVSKTTIPKILDTDDYEFSFNVKMNHDKRGKGFPSKAKDRKASGVEKVEEREEGEEGSTPNVIMYTPGYDYVVEDRTTEEEGIIDLDVSTPTSFKTLLQSTTPTPLRLKPTLQTSSATMYISEAPAYTPPHTSTKTWASTTHHYPVSIPYTTRRINPFSHWMHRVPLTTPLGHSILHTTQAPATTARKMFTTAAPAQPIIKMIKLKKPAVTPKKNTSASNAKKSSSWSKGGRPKSPNQPPESPMSSPTSDQINLMAREPVSMDIFWVVGNWSEVGADIL